MANCPGQPRSPVGYSAARETLNLEDLDRNQAGEQPNPGSGTSEPGFANRFANTPLLVGFVIDRVEVGGAVAVDRRKVLATGVGATEQSRTMLQRYLVNARRACSKAH
jgi:hypothetical protein